MRKASWVRFHPWLNVATWRKKLASFASLWSFNRSNSIRTECESFQHMFISNCSAWSPLAGCVGAHILFIAGFNFSEGKYGGFYTWRKKNHAAQLRPLKLVEMLENNTEKKKNKNNNDDDDDLHQYRQIDRLGLYIARENSNILSYFRELTPTHPYPQQTKLSLFFFFFFVAIFTQV